MLTRAKTTKLRAVTFASIVAFALVAATLAFLPAWNSDTAQAETRTGAGADGREAYPLTPGCPPNWAYVEAPREREYNGLADVSAITWDDVWAVGNFHNVNDPQYPDTALSMHWDGVKWSVVRTGVEGSFHAVKAIAPDNVWAVGEYYTGNDTATLIAHWNGVEWSTLPSPTRDGYSTLTDVDALAPNDVWAVGYNLGFHATLVEHWNGDYWAIIPSPPISFGNNYELNGVTAVAPDDIWAVGRVEQIGTTTSILIEHWDGTEWSIVDAPQPGNYNPALLSVDAISANDIWAVGEYSDDSGATHEPLFMHWDGAEWSQVIGESVPVYNQLGGVVAVAADDVWAVGLHADCTLCIFIDTLIMHWDGTAWTRVYSPNGPREASFLGGVAASSAGDVWAVGATGDLTTPERYSDVLTLHQLCPTGGTPTPTFTSTPTPTATTCSISNQNYTIEQSSGAAIVPATTDLGLHCDECKTTVSLPFPFTLYGQTFSSAIVGSNGTVGFLANSNTWRITCFPTQEFDYAILPYWQELTLDNTGGACPGCGIYTAVEGSAPSRIFDVEWRAMDYDLTSRVNVELRLYENSHDSHFEVIYGAVPFGSNQQVTVGVQKGQGNLFTAFVCNNEPGTISQGTKLTFNQPPCPLNTPTTQPASPTRTPTTTPTGTPTRAEGTPPPTGTPAPATQTPTLCPLNFSDVQPSDYFYDAVGYLYCHGAISGYSDGTFRPYNNTTRGQLTKIVTVAEGWEIDTAGGPTFADVPTTNPFYDYIETAFNHGVISGYSDGTFRWGNNVTRGQLAKIVVSAQGWTADVTGGPHFSDVSPADAFYTDIETLYNHSAISGYADGTFRPGNSATRGQISKIVVSAILSGGASPSQRPAR